MPSTVPGGEERSVTRSPRLTAEAPTVITAWFGAGKALEFLGGNALLVNSSDVATETLRGAIRSCHYCRCESHTTISFVGSVAGRGLHASWPCRGRAR